MKKLDLAIWRINLKLTGWWPLIGSILVLGIFYAIEILTTRHTNLSNLTYPRRAVETIVPLAFALQAAFVLGPDNESAMELLLSYPRPLHKIFWDRILLIGTLHLAIALIASLIIITTWHTENLALALVRWLSAGIALAGIAVFTTQVTRQGVFGTLMATLMWAASLYGGDEILKAWPWFWPFHIYLQPERFSPSIYLLNRLSLIAIGISLTFLALIFLKNVDRLLENR